MTLEGGSPPLLELRSVSLRLGDFAVHAVDLQLSGGEYFVLLGPTGAGKSVLLECVAGLHQPDSGEVRIAGRPTSGVPPEERGLGYLPQDYALFPHLDVRRNIGFGLDIRKTPHEVVRRRVEELAAMLGITHILARDTVTLSGGEQQRVALARALAIRPAILLLDEPMNALDQRTRHALCRELKRVHEDLGTTSIHVSHDLHEAMSMADRVGVIHMGRLLQVGSPEDVFRRPQSSFVAEFVGVENLLCGTARREGGDVVVEAGPFTMRVPEGSPAGEVKVAVRPEDVSLERVGPGDGTQATVAQVSPGGTHCRVALDAGGVELVCHMAPRAYRAAPLQPGDQVEVLLDPEDVHVFQEPGEPTASA